MARSFNVSYRFSARDGFSKVSKKIRSGNRKLGDSFKKLRNNVKRTDSTFKKSSSGMISGFKGMVTAAAAYFAIQKLLTTGGQFESALADLSAITGATGKDLDKLKESTLSMARASVTSQTDVAEGIKLVASAKPELLDNIDALTATTKAVLLLKNAAGIELTSAANITAQGLNIFGAEASKANDFVNVLAAGAKLGSSEIAETGEAMLIAGPGARAAGLSFVQLNAAIQTVAKGGIKGSRSGTALAAIFGRLQRAGIDFQKLGLQGSFEVVKKKMDSLKSSTERAKFAAKIFGEEHSKVGFALMDNVSFLGKYEKSLVGTNIAQEQADIRLKTFTKGAKSLGIILDEKLIRLFDKSRVGIDMVSSAIHGFVSGLDPADIEVFSMVLNGLGTAAAGLGIVLDAAFTVVMSVLKPVFAVFKGIGTAIGQLVAAFATLDFSNFDLSGAFDIGGKFLGLFGDDEPAKVGAPISQDNTSSTVIDVNMNAPKGVVQSIQSTSKGGRNTNVGANMVAG